MRSGGAISWAVLAAGSMLSAEARAHDLVTVTPEPAQVSVTATRLEQAKSRWTAPDEVAQIGQDELRPSMVVLDLRTGFGLPLGEARRFANSRGAADVALGYLASSGRYAGVTAGYSKLDSSVPDFNESTFQFGVDLAYRPRVLGRVEPWLGLGFAWQILWLTKGDFYMKAVGPEFPIVRLGADIRLSEGIAVGPFAAFAYRRYDPFSIEGQTPVELRGIAQRDEWLMLGVSASFGVGR
jgi:hypothetical protein